ncbi:MAG: hypothetical protein ACRDLT_10290 [Solirubrobacteraceae bacterium]
MAAATERTAASDTTAATDTTTTSTGPTSSSSPSTTTAPPTLRVCLAAERRVIASALRVRTATISARQHLASNGMPQCNYLVARAHRGGPPAKVVVTVNVDNGPQAGWRLMRKVVEATQIFGPVPKGWKPPAGVQGLGPYASWFPNLDQLMANNIGRKYLLTVGVLWRHATAREMISLARTATLPYRRIRRLAA